MADKKISELVETTSIDGTELLAVVEDVATTPVTKKVKVANIGAYVFAAGAPRVRKFPFAFNTPGIRTGAPLYVPTVDDILLDAWVQIDVAWDGTTPQLDIGTFGVSVGNQGMFSLTFLGPMGLTADADADFEDPGLYLGNALSSLRDYALLDQVINTLKTPPIDSTPSAAASFVLYNGSGLYSATLPNTLGNRVLPLRFATTDPFKVAVSQNGKAGGADPGSTQGSGALYLVTATPA